MDYDKGLHKHYHAARRLSPETARLWRDVARRYRPAGAVRLILDLGSGTGRFSRLLADAFEALVIGVEPSRKMRDVANRECAHPRVRSVGGDAGSIPVRNGCFDLAWLSMVLHHCSDPAACARELHRVLRPGGRVLVRSSFGGRLGSFPCYDFFPGALAIDEGRLPTIEDARERFEAVGFDFVVHRAIEQTTDESPHGYLDRIRRRAISTFDLIPERDFEEGIRKMEEAVRSGALRGPIREEIDLLVLQRPYPRGRDSADDSQGARRPPRRRRGRA